jgi:hypothetical protein
MLSLDAKVKSLRVVFFQIRMQSRMLFPGQQWAKAGVHAFEKECTAARMDPDLHRIAVRGKFF